jgi:hypothetical protein
MHSHGRSLLKTSLSSTKRNRINRTRIDQLQNIARCDFCEGLQAWKSLCPEAEVKEAIDKWLATFRSCACDSLQKEITSEHESQDDRTTRNPAPCTENTDRTAQTPEIPEEASAEIGSQVINQRTDMDTNRLGNGSSRNVDSSQDLRDMPTRGRSGVRNQRFHLSLTCGVSNPQFSTMPDRRRIILFRFGFGKRLVGQRLQLTQRNQRLFRIQPAPAPVHDAEAPPRRETSPPQRSE